MKKLIASLQRKDGPLTHDLTLRPGAFGLGQVPSRLQPDDVTDLVCGFCSTGCSLTAHLRQGRAINLTPSTDYPVNSGMACPKGWEALAPLVAADRLATPFLRNSRGELEPVDWDQALQVFVLRFKAIQHQHGPDAVAFLSTGQICTEEMALLGAVAKFGMSIVHGDGNTRQCMATAVAAYKESFGFDAPPYTYQDFERSDVLVFIGSNPCIAHPIMWERVCRNPHQPQIIVVDPRKTETAMAATQHYALRPKSDLVLLYGLANLLIARGWIDREYIEQHTAGFEAYAKHVQEFTLEHTAAATGLLPNALERFSETIHLGKRVSFWWTMGVNQGHEATRTAQAIINLALLTGNLGRPGTGANSITGQCNAMGSRLFSNTSNLFGGRDFTRREHRAAVAGILGIPVDRIPDRNSWAYDEIVKRVVEGQVKGLWIIATNPAHSWIDQSRFRQALANLDFLVVQDMYRTTETAQAAHLLLPAAAWGEKEGTFINSERRLGLVKKIARAPGQALSDFRIFQLVAHYWGCEELFHQWTSPEAVFGILKKLSEGLPCDMTGIRDYQMLDANGGVQWPLVEGETLVDSERRLFVDGKFFHPDGRARFCFDQPGQLPETVSERFPYVLLTGRGTSSQWHTETRTAKSAILRKLYPNNIYVEINPVDAAEIGVESGDLVRVISRRDELEATALVTTTVQPGQIFIPMHYRATNRLTFPAFDPQSRQPAYKYCAVAVVSAGQHKGEMF